MLIGPLFLTFATPFFVCLASILTVALWNFWRKNKLPRIPHSHGIITSQEKGGGAKTAQNLIFVFSALFPIFLLFASLNPQLVQTTTESLDARRIVIVCDISGSMGIGTGETLSPLPSLKDSRLGQAGAFISELAKKRRGDAFAFVCFSTHAYVARDFTNDTSQIEEFLSPTDLAGMMNNQMNIVIPESTRIKESSFSAGTWASGGIERAKEFVLAHKDYNGDEIIIYLGDLQMGGRISMSTVRTLQRVLEEDGIKTYAVITAKDLGVEESEQSRAEDVAIAKIQAFDNTGVLAYRADKTQDIQKIAHIIAGDIPKSQTEEEIVSRRFLAPWALLTSFFCLFFALVINERFPRIP